MQETTDSFRVQWKNQQRRIRVAVMRRKKEYRECQLSEIKLTALNAMRRRTNRSYAMLAKPLFKKAVET